jgi:hypothetical protein
MALLLSTPQTARAAAFARYMARHAAERAADGADCYCSWFVCHSFAAASADFLLHFHCFISLLPPPLFSLSPLIAFDISHYFDVFIAIITPLLPLLFHAIIIIYAIISPCHYCHYAAFIISLAAFIIIARYYYYFD